MTILIFVIPIKIGNKFHDRGFWCSIRIMGKYIWPRQLGEATLWYLRILSGKQKLSIDALMAEQTRWNVRHYNRSQMRRQLKFMTDRGLVAKTGSYRNAKYQITSYAINRFEGLKMSKLQAESPWDRKWRIVFFDIPESNRGARDQIRRLLKELGFRQLQLSVWVHPLPCLDYFNEIQQAYGISEHLFLAKASGINIPQSIVSHFQRQYPNQKIK